MLLSDLVDDYLGYCRVERGYALTTQKSYGSHLRQYLTYLAQNGAPTPTLGDFSLPLLRRYQYAAAAKGLRPRSLRAKLIPLRSFGAWIKDNGLLPDNPATGIKIPKLDAANRPTVSDEEAVALLIGAERLPNKRRSAMAKAVVSVLLYTALRRAELVALRLGDVDFKEGSINVRSGKGEKQRTVWPTHETFVALREWLLLRPKAKEDWLWATDVSRPMHFNGLRALVEEVKTVAGLASHDNIKPHAMRRGCATRLMNQGADIRSIQGFLGHSDLATTAVYLASDQQRLKQLSQFGSLSPGQAEPVQKAQGNSSRGRGPAARATPSHRQHTPHIRSGRR